MIAGADPISNMPQEEFKMLKTLTAAPVALALLAGIAVPD